MKTNTIVRLAGIILFATMAQSAWAQQGAMKYLYGNMQYYRYNDRTGINVFETTKNDTTPFDGIKVRIGGNFTENFQALSHQNSAAPVLNADGVNTNQLVSLTNGFNRGMANLNIDAQLADGVRLNLTMYLSSRHHEETWVKGGYMQIDKLSFLKSALIDTIMKNFTIKAGDYELDYGDQHFRRSDGGNAIYNPFMENHIMDQFATEVGSEIYFHPKNGFIAMVGVTNGELNPTVVKSAVIDSATGKLNRYDPAFHGKIGYDKQINEDFRFRITGSFYVVKSAANNTLFGGDRTGSNYVMVTENTLATVADNAFSGRFNPGFREEVQTFMINPFVKFRGLELFATYEMAQGRTISEKTLRTATQYAAELIYRFPYNKENFWIGVRYNSVTATLAKTPNDVSINRVAGSIGWFVTRNIMIKAEYVNQNYDHYAATNILNGAKFSGVMIQGSIAF
jgi:hypothetical protein